MVMKKDIPFASMIDPSLLQEFFESYCAQLALERREILLELQQQTQKIKSAHIELLMAPLRERNQVLEEEREVLRTEAQENQKERAQLHKQNQLLRKDIEKYKQDLAKYKKELKLL